MSKELEALMTSVNLKRYAKRPPKEMLLKILAAKRELCIEQISVTRN